VGLRLLVAFGLTFALGFERQLRGSPAGDRTFALIGVATAVIGALSSRDAPNALAGAVTGVGFIGAGLTFRQSINDREVVRGVTTGAAIFAASAIGAAAGQGMFLVAVIATVLTLLALELAHCPVLRYLDARRWQSRFQPDARLYGDSDGNDGDASGP
jgi:putative Mg2+ transporter-C (MgtC) family protein